MTSLGNLKFTWKLATQLVEFIFAGGSDLDGSTRNLKPVFYV